MNPMKILLAAALVAGLGACATRAPRADVAPILRDPEALSAARAAQATREAWLRGQADWSFAGRVAISQAGKGGNGRLDWRQQGDRYTVSLSAPVTRQSWRLIGDAGGARLEGLDGGPREGADADELLREATGWDIPVRHLADWARALAAPEPGQPPIEPVFGAGGQVLELRQSGWRIAYGEWQALDGAVPAMPRRLDAERGQARVRLIVDQWQFDAP